MSYFGHFSRDFCCSTYSTRRLSLPTWSNNNAAAIQRTCKHLRQQKSKEVGQKRNFRTHWWAWYTLLFCLWSGAHQMELPSPLISWVNPFPSRVINRTIFFCNALESHECACCLLSFLYFHWLFSLLARETSSGNHSIYKSTRERVAWFSDGPGRLRTLSLPCLMDFIQGHVRDVMKPLFFPPIRSIVTYSQKSGILENRA